ncbi:MAG: hypothetical protein V1668_04250 [Patescibacteria group bacterium]
MAIDGLGILAGTIYGVFLGGQIFGGSWVALVICALLGLFFLSQILIQLVLRTAGMIIGMTEIGSTWTDYHERQAQRIAKILLVILIVSGTFGLIFAPMK